MAAPIVNTNLRFEGSFKAYNIHTKLYKNLRVTIYSMEWYFEGFLTLGLHVPSTI